MNITFQIEISNEKIEKFADLEKKCYQIGLQAAREAMKRTLERIDLEIMENRDKGRYRSKGLSPSSIKTMMGEVEYSRRVYVDTACTEGKHCVYLLDTVLDIKKYGLISENVCAKAASCVCESTYRSTAKQLSNLSGLNISHQAVWNVIQQLGEHQRHLLGRYTELANEGAGLGTIETKILYMEADGIWLKLQGASRARHGPSREMKIGIAYDGVQWFPAGNNGKRRILDNKIALAGYMNPEEFRSMREGLIANRFKLSQIEMRVINGDGAQWIQKRNGDKCIAVLDEFHRNKKILECSTDREFACTVRTLLYDKRVDDAIECIETQINFVGDQKEKDKLKDLLSYYKENKNALLSYYDRGIDIPETRATGDIHHARLGSMESNVYTLIGNRMKDNRGTWSINGANNLAALLCAFHTSGFEDLFEDFPELPIKEPEWVDDGHATPAAKMPFTEGMGYEYPHNVCTSNYSRILSHISNWGPISLYC